MYTVASPDPSPRDGGQLPNPNRAGGAGPTSLTLVGPKIFIFMVKALYFQSSGRTNNCQIEVLFKWSDQSCTPSAATA